MVGLILVRHLCEWTVIFSSLDKGLFLIAKWINLVFSMFIDNELLSIQFLTVVKLFSAVLYKSKDLYKTAYIYVMILN